MRELKICPERQKAGNGNVNYLPHATMKQPRAGSWDNRSPKHGIKKKHLKVTLGRFENGVNKNKKWSGNQGKLIMVRGCSGRQKRGIVQCAGSAASVSFGKSPTVESIEIKLMDRRGD